MEWWLQPEILWYKWSWKRWIYEFEYSIYVRSTEILMPTVTLSHLLVRNLKVLRYKLSKENFKDWIIKEERIWDNDITKSNLFEGL